MFSKTYKSAISSTFCWYETLGHLSRIWFVRLSSYWRRVGHLHLTLSCTPVMLLFISSFVLIAEGLSVRCMVFSWSDLTSHWKQLYTILHLRVVSFFEQKILNWPHSFRFGSISLNWGKCAQFYHHDAVHFKVMNLHLSIFTCSVCYTKIDVPKCHDHHEWFLRSTAGAII